MTRSLRLSLARPFAVGVIALLSLAALVTASRFTLPAADHYRERVASTLSERLGYQVRIGSLSLGLTGWTPRLTLNQVALEDPEAGSEVLSLRALVLDLDLAASIHRGSPQVRALTLVGARLALHRLSDGRIRIRGLEALQPEDPRPLERFLHQGRLILIDSEIGLIGVGSVKAPPRLIEVQLRLVNEGPVHRLDLQARPRFEDSDDRDLVPEDASRVGSGVGAAGGLDDARMRLLAELLGDGLDPTTWGGRIYLALSGADVLARWPPRGPDPVPVRAQALALEAWLRLSAGRLEEALGRLTLDGLHLPAPGPQAPEIRTDRLRALARLAPTTDGWRLGVRDLSLSMQGAELSGLGLDLRLSHQGRLERLDALTDRLDLALVGSLARSFLGRSPAIVEVLRSLDPRGRLSGIALALERPLNRLPTWRLAAQGEGIGVTRAGRIPGIERLSLGLGADQDGGELRLGPGGLRLDLAPWLDRPLHFDRFSGSLGWTRGLAGALHLAGRDLTLENPDLRGRIRFRLDLPPLGGTDAGSGPFLDLRARLEDDAGAWVRAHLPVGALKPGLVQWLGRAPVGGRIPQGDLILRGPLRHFPFREHQGRFELLLKVEDLGLRFQRDWPPIEGASGFLRLINQGMEAELESARILDSAIHSGRASIQDLWTPPRLDVHGQFEGPLSDGLRVLGETPLAARLGPLARALEVAGTARLTLDLDLPLVKGGPVGLDGRLSWPGPAQVALKGTPLTLTDLAGELRFTNRTLAAESIEARLWGQPLTLAIVTRESAIPGDSVTEFLARSRLSLRDLAGHLPSPVRSLARGELAWDLGVELPTLAPRLGETPLRWRLASDLRGVTLDLPPPLGKSADQPRSLELEGALLPGRSLSVHGGLGVLGLDLHLDLAATPVRLARGRLRLDTKVPVAGESVSIPEGLRVEGNLSQLDLSRWGAWWTRVRTGWNGQVDWGDRAPITVPDPVTLDLSIARLGLGSMALTDVRVRSETRGAVRTLELDSQELSGELDLPTPGSGLPLGLHLARLDLASLIPPEDSKASSQLPGSPVDLSLVPLADLRVEDLRWADEGLGRLALDLRPESSALRVPRIEFQGPGGTRMHGDATWLDGSEGGRTRLALNLTSADLGPLVRALGYKAAFSAAPLESSIRLEWQGGPGAFALARSSGTMDLKVGPGRLLELEPGVGRVLGILNLGALGRRLSLDFRDLYEQGFSFEEIRGDIRVADGQAQLRRFEIDGPSSTIRVTGLTDLRTRTFDQTVTVEPRIGSSVALVSALAGGPVVGAAVYLADKVSGGSIDKLGSYRYRVSGPWMDPELTPLGWDPFARQGEPGTLGAARPAIPSQPAVRPAGSHFLD